jgi:histone H3/H4|tara:strand:- start:569 stop:907 length:339 start_codon:yes stop_codon:yes gene_type:complete
MSSITEITTTKQHSAKKSRKQRRNEKEVATLQERITSILPATTFKRIVTQEAAKHSTEPLRFNVDAIQALQTAAEQEITTIFSGAAFCANIAKRETITVEDMQNFQNLRELY